MEKATTVSVLAWLSLLAWGFGTSVLGVMLWQDWHQPNGLNDDVGGGLAALAALAGLGVFVISLIVGIVLGWTAVRRDPDRALPTLARWLNVVTLVGAVLSIVVLILFAEAP